MAQEGKPLKFKTVKELEKKINEYFALCAEEWEEKVDYVPKTIMRNKIVVQVVKEGKVQYNKVVKMVHKKPRVPTVSGLAVHLETSRQTLLEYEGEVEGREKDVQYADTIKKAKQYIESHAESLLLEGGVHPSGVIFNLKNNWNWTDQKDVNFNNRTETPVPVSKMGPLTEEEDAELLAKLGL